MSRPYVTHCAQGHDMSDAYWSSGRRQCRTCQRIRQRDSRSHCKRGHEFTDDNTIITETGRRRCRTCRNARTVQRRTHCTHGHEFTPENTITTDKQRRCRICRTASNARAHAKPKAPKAKAITGLPYDPDARPVCEGRDEFTADDKVTLRRAAKACRLCPLVPECAARALTDTRAWGVYAGVVLNGAFTRNQRLALEHMASRMTGVSA